MRRYLPRSFGVGLGRICSRVSNRLRLLVQTSGASISCLADRPGFLVEAGRIDVCLALEAFAARIESLCLSVADLLVCSRCAVLCLTNPLVRTAAVVGLSSRRCGGPVLLAAGLLVGSATAWEYTAEQHERGCRRAPWVIESHDIHVRCYSLR